jgi:hypothetical protein
MPKVPQEAMRGNRVFVQPATVHVTPEIGAGFTGGVHIFGVDTAASDFLAGETGSNQSQQEKRTDTHVRLSFNPILI